MNFHNKTLAKSTKTIEKSLLIIAIICVLTVFKLLSFVVIPLVAAALISLLFMPLVRWCIKKNISNWLTMPVVLIISFTFIGFLILLVRFSSNEISSVDTQFWFDSLERINQMLIPVLDLLGFEHLSKNNIGDYIQNNAELSRKTYTLFGSVLNFTQRTIIMLVMTLFYVVLFLSGSVNVRKVMQAAVFDSSAPAARTFVILEKSIGNFLIVKFFVSLATGIVAGLLCVAFDLKFPFFWGVVIFVTNFVQLFGPIASSTLLSLFALSQIDSTGTAFTFILILIAIQIVFGSVLEPIFMGKAFSINTITVLVMLMFWGYLWGVAGMLLSVPITVAVKTVLSQSNKYKIISDLME